MIKLSTPFRFIVIIIIGLFVSEVIVMGVIGTMDSMPYLRLSIIDAFLMILLATPFLYFFSLRPLLKVISEREAEIIQRKQTEIQLRIQTTALETAANGVIVTDKDGEILWANQAFAHMTGYSVEEALGKSPNFLNSGVHDPDFHKRMWETILSGNVWHGEVTNRHKDGALYVNEQTITPVFNSSGAIENFIAIQQDVTERKRSESIMQSRLRLMQFATSHTLDELLTTTLDEIEALTGSTIGFFHFLEADQKMVSLQAWSTNTLQNMCNAEGKGSHYSVEQAGVWADCIRQRKPVVHNDYEALPNRKGMPEGHAPLIRELTVPILRNEKVVAILGVGDKPLDYTASDVEMVSALADFAWDVIERKRAVDALVESEEKFRTFVDWTYDWETWLDPQGNIVYTSPSCGRITGFSHEDFIADSNLLIQIIHPDDRPFYEEHQQALHNELAGPLNVEFRIIARDGSEHWIEHICRPLYGKDNRYLGRRVSNRDVTERKRTEKDIKEREQKENMLTKTIHTMQMDIARDLHDTVGQNISYLRMKLDDMVEKELLTDPDIAVDIKRMNEVANESYDLIRGTLAVLQSEDSTDLSHLFARYAIQIEERSNFKVEFSSKGETRLLSAKRMRQLFYIYREILSNIEKHANASKASIEIRWSDDHLFLVVFDDGCGFDTINNVQHGGRYGLKFMRERVELLEGTLVVNSAPGAGTNIVIHVPFEIHEH